jgi:SAM-dependent methyltransferase
MAAVDKWNERYAASKLVWSQTVNKELANQVSGYLPSRALDLGAGEGRNAIWLAGQGWQVTAVDFSQVGIDKGKQLALSNRIDVNWVVSDACEYDDQDGFDLVVVLYLHTARAERDLWLANAINLVRPGGDFIYIGHDPENIVHGVGGPQNPEVLPDVDEFTRRLSDFDIVQSGIVERATSVETGHAKSESKALALDCLVNAKRRAG